MFEPAFGTIVTLKIRARVIISGEVPLSSQAESFTVRLGLSMRRANSCSLDLLQVYAMDPMGLFADIMES